MSWMSTTQLQKIIDKTMWKMIVSLGYSHQHHNAGLLQRWFELIRYKDWYPLFHDFLLSHLNLFFLPS